MRRLHAPCRSNRLASVGAPVRMAQIMTYYTLATVKLRGSRRLAAQKTSSLVVQTLECYDTLGAPGQLAYLRPGTCNKKRSESKRTDSGRPRQLL